jgi:hypothetical protein
LDNSLAARPSVAEYLCIVRFTDTFCDGFVRSTTEQFVHRVYVCTFANITERYIQQALGIYPNSLKGPGFDLLNPSSITVSDLEDALSKLTASLLWTGTYSWHRSDTMTFILTNKCLRV